ncbi:hypothetical protein Z517_04377 [Fonsecaea pedrosoi CBS 271.37]|uniref:Uncharacterized protein n=1 Tax=Fonsecaea pedrosoi CBS 271.37 TaxID=1442368 RepID=A0A0D2F3V3_9EURO|nr:uncharacterized protein Z517_04377 [Fonsecaea pedrosoi CBS 271.37]KIW81352.1 hypothetical protein Z517_04377 [Fonsecaea pedrosoi CBS 271.37]
MAIPGDDEHTPNGAHAEVSDNEPVAVAPEVPAMLHVHDLPQLHQKPSATTLLRALDLLVAEPSSFSPFANTRRPKVSEQGVSRYLTSIVSSGLNWIGDEDQKDAIWGAASARLSERSGRSAMPAMTRSFEICTDLTVNLHEPTLTEDNLGLKTWTSSVLLSRRLQDCRRYLPTEPTRVLELGAGTGLVGISAACIWKTHVLLTDLPQILPNLRGNLEQNQELITRSGGSTESRALDWVDETDTPKRDEDKFMVIVAADSIYSPEHPKMLVNAVTRWICRSPEARFIIELPLRDGYDEERQNLRSILQQHKFDLVLEGTEVGFDDWYQQDGSPSEVTCWWSIWRPNTQV